MFCHRAVVILDVLGVLSRDQSVADQRMYRLGCSKSREGGSLLLVS